MTTKSLLLAIGVLAVAEVAVAQGPPDSAALLAAQREAMATFAFLDGQWREPTTSASLR